MSRVYRVVSLGYVGPLTMQSFPTRRSSDLQLLVRAQTNAEAGTRPPRFSYEGVIDQSEKITTGTPFDDGEPSALWEATQSKLARSEEHTSELQSRENLVCRLLLEKKKTDKQ